MDDDAFRFGTLTQRVKGWLRGGRFLAPWSFTGGSIAVLGFNSGAIGRIQEGAQATLSAR